MKKILFSLLVFWAIQGTAEPYVIKQLDIRQGLSNNYIVSMAQDKQGFLWFATEEGLNKFDGTRFITYYKHHESITGNELNCVYDDPNDSILWIGTQRNGLNAYDYINDRFTAYLHDGSDPYSLSTNDITDITSATNGNLWIATYHRGVDYMDKSTGKFTHYNSSTIEGFPSDNVWKVMDDGGGNLYIGHVVQGLSVLSLKDNKIKNYRFVEGDPHSLPGNDVRAIHKDNNGNIWIGTNNGLALFDKEAGKFMTFNNGQGSRLSANIYAINQLGDNKLWIGTELNGIYILDLKQQFFLSPGQLGVEHIAEGGDRYSLSNATARYIFQDSFKNIWIGTYGGGINFIPHTPPLFNLYSYSPLPTDENSLNNKVVSSICIDNEGNMWIGTDGGGLNVFRNGKRIRIYTKETSPLSHNSILSSFKDSNGNLWFGTFQAGVNFYDSRTKQFTRIAIGGEYHHDVRCFFEDKNKNLWIGTNEGIYVLDLTGQRPERHYHMENIELLDNLIRSIAKDSAGRLWVGTFGGGLNIYSEEMEHIASYYETTGFPSNTINHLLCDSRNRMWIATGGGVVRFDDKDHHTYTTLSDREGLSNLYIRALAEDSHGNIWFSTNVGISCFRNDSGEVFNYNHYDNSPMGSFMSGAVTQDNHENIYFGSINGVCFFDPRTVSGNREVPPVVITEMRIYGDFCGGKDGRRVNLSTGKIQKIKLNHKENTFNITFNIQDYALANQVRYVYNLKGLDDTWYAVNENNIMFRNIPPGDYQFRVRAQIHNQSWEGAITTFTLAITPPLWLTWWAKLIYFLMGLGILFFLLYTYKKRLDFQISYEIEKKNHEQEQELNNERLRFYTNITHELRTPLTLILGPLEDMQKDTTLPVKQQQKVSVIHQSAVRLLNLINQILEFRKTETQHKKLCVGKGNIAALVQEIGLKYKELNRNPRVQFTISVEHDQMLMYFDKEAVTIIIDNLVSNAIKYTEKGTIGISLYTTIKEDVSYTEVCVSDTGHGISPEALSQIFNRYYQVNNEYQASGTGIGLALVKNLVGLHEGEIRAESNVGQGSSFYFTLLTHNIYPNALHEEANEKSKQPDEPQPETEPGEDTPDAKPILLVVEDNPDIREYITESFSPSFEVITAENGQAGVRAAQAKIPDIIVSDIMMPVMNGIALCRIIKDDVRTSHIPVILLTAKDSLQDKEEGYVAGADSYLTKPFSASLLHSRINNLMESRKKLAGQINANTDLTEKAAMLNQSLNKLDNEFILRLTEVIEEKLNSEKIDITYLSDKMCMSSSTLYRKVKALTGMSTNEYVRKIKMRNAEQLLLEGKYNISEIAFKVGINSTVYFRQCFREEFGASPSDYLKQLKGK